MRSSMPQGEPLARHLEDRSSPDPVEEPLGVLVVVVGIQRDIDAPGEQDGQEGAGEVGAPGGANANGLS